MAVSLGKLLQVFLVMGATGFGTSMVPYYQRRLVHELKWLDEEEFLETLHIAQAMPGLNATNLSVLIGDRLAGPAGAWVATLALLLPGALALCVMGSFYAELRHDPRLDPALDAVAAGAAGLLVATAWKLGKKQFLSPQVVVLLAATVLVGWYQVSLPIVLLVLAPLNIWWHRPR